jgi:hypothetical protein
MNNGIEYIWIKSYTLYFINIKIAVAIFIFIRDLSLMVKYETFNLCYMSSNLIDLNLILKY